MKMAAANRLDEGREAQEPCRSLFSQVAKCGRLRIRRATIIHGFTVAIFVRVTRDSCASLPAKKAHERGGGGHRLIARQVAGRSEACFREERARRSGQAAAKALRQGDAAKRQGGATERQGFAFFRCVPSRCCYNTDDLLHCDKGADAWRSRRGAGRGRMFDSLVIGYLFLGGAGGGALVVLAALEGVRSLAGRRLGLPDEFFARAWPVSTVALAAGIVCIFADLGRPDRLFALVLSPQPTPPDRGRLRARRLARLRGGVLGPGARRRPSRFASGPSGACGRGDGGGPGDRRPTPGCFCRGSRRCCSGRRRFCLLRSCSRRFRAGWRSLLGVAAFVEARRPFVRPLVMARAGRRRRSSCSRRRALRHILLWGFSGRGHAARQLKRSSTGGPGARCSGAGVVGGGACGALRHWSACVTHGNHRSQLLWIGTHSC